MRARSQAVQVLFIAAVGLLGAGLGAAAGWYVGGHYARWNEWADPSGNPERNIRGVTTNVATLASLAAGFGGITFARWWYSLPRNESKPDV
jgi:hypothetical protein